MGRYAVYEDDGGLITNVIVWDGVAPYAPPTGQSVVIDVAGVATPGGTYTGGQFHPPPDPPPPTPTVTIDDVLTQLQRDPGIAQASRDMIAQYLTPAE